MAFVWLCGVKLSCFQSTGSATSNVESSHRKTRWLRRDEKTSGVKSVDFILGSSLRRFFSFFRWVVVSGVFFWLIEKFTWIILDWMLFKENLWKIMKRKIWRSSPCFRSFVLKSLQMILYAEGFIFVYSNKDVAKGICLQNVRAAETWVFEREPCRHMTYLFEDDEFHFFGQGRLIITTN